MDCFPGFFYEPHKRKRTGMPQGYFRCSSNHASIASRTGPASFSPNIKWPGPSKEHQLDPGVARFGQVFGVLHRHVAVGVGMHD